MVELSAQSIITETVVALNIRSRKHFIVQELPPNIVYEVKYLQGIVYELWHDGIHCGCFDGALEVPETAILYNTEVFIRLLE